MINQINTGLLGELASKMEDGEKINIFSPAYNGIITCLVCGQELMENNLQVLASHREAEIMLVERIVAARLKRKKQ